MGDGHQSGGVAARRRRRSRGAEEARAVRGLGECALQRYRRCRRACAVAGAGLGREIRHGDQFGAPHLAPARVPAVAGRGEAGLVDPERGRKTARLRRRVRLQIGRRYLSRARRALGVRERWQPRFRYRRVDLAVGRGLRRDGAGAVAGARRRARRRQRFFAEGGFFANDRKARFVAPEVPALRDRDRGRAAAAAQHRPHPRSVAHHDPHRREPAARPASAGAVRRGASRRCRCDTASTDGELCPHHHRLRPMHAESRGQRTPAARHAVCADPLERGERHAAARVGSLVAPFTDPFSGQPENKATPASIAPYEYVFRGFALSRKPLALPRACLVGARRRDRRLRLSASPTMPTSQDWQSWLRSRSPARISPNTATSAVASIAARPLPAIASRRACSSVPRRCRRLERGEEPVRRR